MTEIIKEIISAFFGSLGFSILFRLRHKLWFPASLGGGLAWSLYLLLFKLTGDIFTSTLFSAGFGAIYAEVLARYYRAPATLFVIPAMVPHIPGGALYYMMSYFVQGNKLAASTYAELVLIYATAIAAGISIVWALWAMIRKFLLDRKIKNP